MPADSFYRYKSDANAKAAALRAEGYAVRVRKGRADHKGEWIVIATRRKAGTKAERKKNASKRSKQKRIAEALKKFLRAQNPASIKKYSGAKITRHKGGRISITPVKVTKKR